jgi:hypothetical protein
MEEYWKQIKERRLCTEISVFSDLGYDIWQQVLEQFIVDIMIILDNAPPADDDIYCYRGSTFDYLVPNGTPAINMIAVDVCVETKLSEFISLRFGSFAINYNSSKPYATAVMYRSKIAKGTRVLYIQPLSFASHEYEILHNIFAKFSVNSKATTAYNNKDNKFGILSNKSDEFKSADISLDKYTCPSYTIDIYKNVYNKPESIDKTEVFQRIYELYSKNRSDVVCIADLFGGRKTKKHFKNFK